MHLGVARRRETARAPSGPVLAARGRATRPRLADRWGGARDLLGVRRARRRCVGRAVFPAVGPSGGSFAGFFAMFMLLFLGTGIGNGSTFRMIPVIFFTERQRGAADKEADAQAQAIRDGNKEAAAVLGFSGAIGAYGGGFSIPKRYGTSIAIFGGPEQALYAFIVFYLTCVVTTWWFYSRKRAPMP